MKANRPVGAPRRALFSAVRHPVRSILLIGVCALSTCLLVVSLSMLGVSVETQAEGVRAAAGSYRLELDIGNLRKRLVQLPFEYSHGDAWGGLLTDVPDNAFQSVLMDDVEKLAEAPGVAWWNVVAVPAAALLLDLERIEDPDHGQTLDLGGVNVVGGSRPNSGAERCRREHRAFQRLVDGPW